MANKLANPMRCQVRAEISFHEALAAVEALVRDYPAERLSHLQAEILEDAAICVRHKLAERENPWTRTNLK